jgi:hypothetical protein
MPTPPSAIAAPDFAHDDGDVLHCLGEYASSFLFVYGEEPDLSVLKE